MFYIVHSLSCIFVMYLNLKQLKLKKMKTVINSTDNVISESVKRIWDSFQFVMAVVLLPLLFIVGISHNNERSIYENGIHVSKQNTTNLKATANYSEALSDQNS